MPVFKIKHITRYKYDAPVHNSANQIMLFPLKDDYQKVVRHALNISNHPEVEMFHDYYNNEVGTFTQHEAHSELLISSEITVETSARPLPADRLPAPDQWLLLDELQYDMMFLDYLKQEVFEGAASLQQTALDLKQVMDTPLATAIRFCEYVFTHFDYIKGVTTVNSTLDEILELKAGVCQDFAHLLTALLRFSRIPARYVSGYICPNKNGMRGEGATHAWAEAWIPEYGWLGIDPTNNCIVGEQHVKLAVGRNFSDCSPVKGVYSGESGHTLDVSVSVGYDDGESEADAPQFPAAEQAGPPVSTYAQPVKNSYRQHLEEIMQMQQQQQ